MIDGSMQTYALTLDKVLSHAAKWHPGAEVVSAGADGGIARIGYAEHIAQGERWLAEGQEMAQIAETLTPRLVGSGALPEGVALATFCQRQVPAATWRHALQAMSGFDRRAALAHIHVPTLLVAGEQDHVAPPAAMQAMAGAIAGAELLCLPATGHLPHLEQPDAFDAALLDFLRRARPRLH